MGAIGELVVRISANTDQALNAIRGLGDDVRKSMSDPLPASQALATAIAGFGVAAAAGFGAAAVAAVRMAGEFEQSEIAFGTLLGSGQKAKTFLADLSKFAASTPFELTGLQSASRKLLAFGFDSNSIIPIMKNVGDAIAGLGGGAAEIDRVTMALGQMKAKGKVSAEEMMQLAEMGIPAWDILAKKIGKSVPEAMEMASKGAIPAATAINALVDGMGEKFGGLMDKQSKSLLGTWSNLQDNISSIGRTIGKELMTSLDITGQIGKINDALTGLSNALLKDGLMGSLAKLFSPEVKVAVIAIGGAIAGALVPSLQAAAIAGKAAAINFAAALVPLLPFIAAGTALALVGYTIYKNWEPISAFFANTWNQIATSSTMALLKIQRGWDVLKELAGSTFSGIASAVKVKFLQIEGTVKQTVNAVISWFSGLPGRLIGLVNKAIDPVANKFRWLYDVVVGNSYVPDMVEETEACMKSLKSRMVPHVKQATEQSAQLFRTYSQETEKWLRHLAKAERDFAAEAAANEKYAQSLLNQLMPALSVTAPMLLTMTGNAQGLGDTLETLKLKGDGVEDLFQVATEKMEANERAAKALGRSLDDLTKAQIAELEGAIRQIAERALPGWQDEVAQLQIKLGDFKRTLEDGEEAQKNLAETHRRTSEAIVSGVSKMVEHFANEMARMGIISETQASRVSAAVSSAGEAFIAFGQTTASVVSGNIAGAVSGAIGMFNSLQNAVRNATYAIVDYLTGGMATMADVIGWLGKELDRIAQKESLLGDLFDEDQAKISAYQRALERLIDAGAGSSAIVQEIANEIRNLEAKRKAAGAGAAGGGLSAKGLIPAPSPASSGGVTIEINGPVSSQDVAREYARDMVRVLRQSGVMA